MEIYLATKNEHKVSELNDLAKGTSLRFIGIHNYPSPITWDENGADFRSNALIKAQAVAAATGKPVLSDDSGLLVHILDGEPGVHTARYAGPQASDAENYHKLLKRLDGIPLRDRTAEFVCCLCLLLPGEAPRYFEGSLEGQISLQPSGEKGFGYDPIFWLEGRDCTLADLSPIEKNLISHRFQAMRKFLDWYRSAGY